MKSDVSMTNTTKYRERKYESHSPDGIIEGSMEGSSEGTIDGLSDGISGSESKVSF